MVDKELLLRKLADLEEYFLQIKEYEMITVAEYTEDWKSQRIVERTLQIMIETCVDIAGHIISDKGYRVPKTYADTFRVLQEEEILDKGLFKTMEKMAKFRNVVVHDYDKVDTEIVVTILRKHLDDFLHYKNAIVALLKQMD
jgi:uncharacterized protein YutE (UPF0331/DUF86 family)